MTRRLTILSACVLLVMFAAPVAQAAPIFSNFGNSLGYNTSIANPVGYDFFSGDNDTQGVSFISGVNATLGSITIALSNFSGTNTNPVNVAFRSNAAGLPGSLLESFVLPPFTLGAFGVHNAPLVLTSSLNPAITMNAKYWLTVSTAPQDSTAWNLNLTGDPNPTATSVDGGVVWNNLGLTPGAYQIDSPETSTVVPEPATILLVGNVLLTLAIRKWRV